MTAEWTTGQALRDAVRAGLKPAEAMNLTIGEIARVIEGQQWREEREWRYKARLTQMVMASNGLSEPPTVEEILGRE